MNFNNKSNSFNQMFCKRQIKELAIFSKICLLQGFIAISIIGLNSKLIKRLQLILN
jgi:hypothetical protein